MSISSFVEIGDTRLEYVRIPAAADGLPPLVFLHEGLGSVAMWRDFPQRVAAATGAETVVYSRRGYGKSSKLAGKRAVDYMHREARETLPAVLQPLKLQRPILIGHSDGASIALIHAAGGHDLTGLVVMAPHIFVEDLTITSIEGARETYRTTDLGKRLGRYHDDADHTFWGWNDIWLDPAFRTWNIEALLPNIRAPILALQGADDEYGTPAQVTRIRDQVLVPCTVTLLQACKHSPHRDQPEATLRAISRFVESLVADHPNPGPATKI
jgi:pimeloyl-ACP methyl ester carboxylesterase